MLYATVSIMHNLYGHIVLNPSYNETHSFSLIGQSLEDAIERQGYKVTLPTDADWGYVFRTEFNRKDFDISIVSLLVSNYAIAIEHPKEMIDSVQQESITNGLL
jgi:hypothetical protein